MNFKSKLRTPITYYGGKQQMLQHIIPNIPAHESYNEPCVGGGAVFWAKEPSPVETINDINGEVINFYKVVQTDFWRLNEMIQATLHSRELYQDAMVVYTRPHLFDPIRRAWAFWVATNQGFSAMIGAWGYDKKGASMVKRMTTKKEEFTIALRNRLDHVQIECNDAISVITSRDSPNTFHYIDPPYIGSDQGHYHGYTEMKYRVLLDRLTTIEGKFLQSSYWSELLAEYVKQNGWRIKKYPKPVAAGKKKSKTKVEILVANYELI